MSYNKMPWIAGLLIGTFACGTDHVLAGRNELDAATETPTAEEVGGSAQGKDAGNSADVGGKGLLNAGAAGQAGEGATGASRTEPAAATAGVATAGSTGVSGAAPTTRGAGAAGQSATEPGGAGGTAGHQNPADTSGGSAGAAGSGVGGDTGASLSAELGISCGAATCTAGTEVCCDRASSRACTADTCSGAVMRLQCDDANDCAGSLCCFTNILESAMVSTMCMNDCSSLSGIQVCTQTADCKNGGPCRTYSCSRMTDTGNPITLGLCTETAPYFCK